MRGSFERLMWHLSTRSELKKNKSSGVDYRRDRESERRVRDRGRGRRLRAMDEDDRTTCVECGPYGIVIIIAYVLYTQWQMR